MKEESLVLENSLQAYFYDQLREINQKSSHPILDEIIYYSSRVMDRFISSEDYFERIEGRVREKILGTKLLEAAGFPRPKQKRVLKDVGDTALFVCGYFSESLNNRLIDARYYQQLGESAYQRLNGLVPALYDIPSFYRLLGESFCTVTMIMALVSRGLFGNQKESEESYFISSLNKLKAAS